MQALPDERLPPEVGQRVLAFHPIVRAWRPATVHALLNDHDDRAPRVLETVRDRAPFALDLFPRRLAVHAVLVIGIVD